MKLTPLLITILAISAISAGLHAPRRVSADTLSALSRRPQEIGESAAAVTILTADDIRRSGATSIPEALRLVPGLDVARINESSWAVSSRGFNSLFASKMLVLVDGRSIYNPLSAGVYWDEVDLPLEDLDRIEVVRGPGAAIWGENAVNGVVNILTKNAGATQGVLISGGGGNKEKLFGTSRYGGALGDDMFYRAYAKYNNRDNFERISGGEANDSWEDMRTGVRLDSTISESDRVTVQSDAYYGEQGTTLAIPTLDSPYSEDEAAQRFSNGVNILSRWEHDLAQDSQLQLQAYYDRVNRDDLILTQHRDTFDLGLQHHLLPFANDDLVYGMGYRLYRDDLENSETVNYDPETRNVDRINWFAQNEIALIDRRLLLTIGSQFEHNEFSGFEFQPTARALWSFNDTTAIWAAISRAVRTPSRSSNDLRYVEAVTRGEDGAPVTSTIFGNSGVDAENLLAYESGFRAELTPGLSIDLAGFYNDYSDLQSLESQPQMRALLGEIPTIVSPLLIENQFDGHSYGGEVSVDWRVDKDWRLVGYYSYLKMQLSADPGSGDTTSEAQEDQSPEHQVMLRSLLNLPGDLEFDSSLRYVDDLPNLDVDSYLELDLRLAWQAAKNLEISVVGQNLLDNNHEEFSTTLPALEKVAIERGVYGKVIWTY